jgi:hypothetical protein
MFQKIFGGIDRNNSWFFAESGNMDRFNNILRSEGDKPLSLLI